MEPKINNICATLDDNDEISISIKKSFFKVRSENAYTLDIYGTNKTIHYEEALVSAGFVLYDDEADDIR